MWVLVRLGKRRRLPRVGIHPFCCILAAISEAGEGNDYSRREDPEPGVF